MNIILSYFVLLLNIYSHKLYLANDDNANYVNLNAATGRFLKAFFVCIFEKFFYF